MGESRHLHCSELQDKSTTYFSSTVYRAWPEIRVRSSNADPGPPEPTRMPPVHFLCTGWLASIDVRPAVA